MNIVTKFLLGWSLFATLMALSFFKTSQWAREEADLLHHQLKEHSTCPSPSIIQMYWAKFATMAAILFFTLFWISGSPTSSSETARLEYELKELKIKTMTKQITNECSICLNNPFQVVLIPCGHICLCTGCLKQLRLNKKCPVCRSNFEKHINIYFS